MHGEAHGRGQHIVVRLLRFLQRGQIKYVALLQVEDGVLDEEAKELFWIAKRACQNDLDHHGNKGDAQPSANQRHGQMETLHEEYQYRVLEVVLRPQRTTDKHQKSHRLGNEDDGKGVMCGIAAPASPQPAAIEQMLQAPVD